MRVYYNEYRSIAPLFFYKDCIFIFDHRINEVLSYYIEDFPDKYQYSRPITKYEEVKYIWLIKRIHIMHEEDNVLQDTIGK